MQYKQGTFDSTAYDAAIVAPATPIVWYRFEETTGTDIADSSGNGWDAITIGSPTLNVTPFIKGAIQFNGVDQAVRREIPTPLANDKNAITGITFFKMPTTQTGNSLFTAINPQRANIDGRGVYMGIADGSTAGDPYAQMGDTVSSTFNTVRGDVPYYGINGDNQWHMFVVVINATAGTMKIFLDGNTEIDSLTFSGLINNTNYGNFYPSPGQLYVGGRSDDNGGAGGTDPNQLWYQGIIGEVIWYNVALSGAQIQTIYDSSPLG